MSRFTGREYDGHAGLTYHRARWYDPSAGVFISEDPIGFAGGDTNLYRYCGNSPANATDPSGLFWETVYGHGGWVDRAATTFFENNPDWVEPIAGMSDAAVVGTSIALAVPLGIGLYFGGSAVVGMGLTGAGMYFATQAGLSAVETTVEWGIANATGSEFSWGASFGKNFVINSATGGIGSKGKWFAKAGTWAARQGIEIAGDTAIDVGVYGHDLETALAWNTVGSIGGEAAFKALGRGWRAFDNTFEVRLKPGAMTTLYSGLPVDILSISRRAPKGAVNSFDDLAALGIDAPRVRQGANGKVAIIGRGMDDNVKQIQGTLRKHGIQAEIFDASSEYVDAQAFRRAAQEFKLASNSGANAAALKKLDLFEMNRKWAHRIRDEGFTVIDGGDPLDLFMKHSNPNSRGWSVYYALEKSIFFD